MEDHPLSAPEGSKGERGSVLVVGGPAECPGAVLLAAEAALRSGAGRVQLVVHPTIAPHVAVAAPECFVIGWDLQTEPSQQLVEVADGTDAVVIGPGHSDDLTRVAQALAELATTPSLILDAGALPAARELAAVRPLVLAPNIDEAVKLAGDRGSDVELALALGDKLGCPLAVRGRATTVTDGRGAIWHHQSSASGLGTPGSGDVLMGALIALLARGVPPTAALGWAVTVHDRAAEIVERSMPVGYLARDVLARLPSAFVELGAA